MVSAQDVLITFRGKDDVSSTTSGIHKNISSLSSAAGTAIDNISNNMSMLDSSIMSSFGSVTGKTISEEIFGTSSTAETNKILLKNMSDTADGADQLYQRVDEVTNSSLIGMQELIPVMKSFKSATGSSDETLSNVTDEIANFGASVLATTGSSELAQTAMEKLSYGIKGSYAALDQYGITEDSLKNTGLWSGKEDDVEGYMAAVNAVTGSTKELMSTNTGLDAQISKAFSKAGKDIGSGILPGVKQLKQAFLDLNKSTGGGLAVGILEGGAAVSTIAQGLGTVGAAANGLKSIKQFFTDLSPLIAAATAKLGLFTAAEETAETTGVAGSTAEKFTSMTPMNADFIEGKFGKKGGKAVEEAADGVDDLADGATKVGSTAEKGAEGAGKAGKGLSLMSASLSQMLAPLLKLSLVVAIMIPIIAALAAEALIFARGIGELIVALDFESLNLGPQIDGIKQIGTAMWELARTMAAMSLAAVGTIIYEAVGKLMGIFEPIKTAVAEIRKAIPIINQLGSVGTINSAIPAKLKSLTTALHGVGIAIQSMMGVTANLFLGQVLTLGGTFGNLSSNLKNGMKDIKTAVTEINNMKGLPSVDSGAATKLKAIGEALKGVSDAVKALSGVTWEEGIGKFISNLGNMKGTMGSLAQARGEIIAAVPIINSFASMPEVNKSAGTKLKAMGDALTKVNDAIKSLSNLNWNVGGLGSIFNGDMIGSLNKARTQLGQASVILAGFSTLANIPSSVGTKVQRVGWSITTVTNSVNALNKIKTAPHDFTGMITNLQKARTGIGQASTLIAGFSTIANIPSTVTAKLNKVSAVLPTIKTATSRMKTIPTVNNTANIKKAVKAIKDTATELAGLNNIKSVKSNSALSSINTAIQKINQILRTSTASIRASSVNIGKAIGQGIKTGLGNLSAVIMPPFNTAMSALIGQATSKGQQVGTNVKNGFKTGISGMKQIAATEVANTLSAITSQQSAFSQAGQSLGAAAANGYKTGAQTNSPGLMAHTADDEVHYTLGFLSDGVGKLFTAGQNLGYAVASGFLTQPNPIGASGIGNINTGLSPKLNSAKDISNLNKLGGGYTPKNNTVHHTTLNINEGAVKLDARNLSTRECKEVMINGLEGLDAVEGVLTKKSSGSVTTNNATSDAAKTKTSSNIASTGTTIFTNQKTNTGTGG